MRTLTILTLTLLMTLLLSACSKEAPPTQEESKPTAHEPQPASQPSQQVIEKADQEMKETVGAVTKEVEKEATDVKKEATEVVQEVKTTASEATAQVKEDVSSAVSDLKTAVPAATAPVAHAAAPPESVTYEASMGLVTFNHAEHAGRFDCSKCHPTDPPQKIAIDKEVAHNQLCKVCHKESGGNAPVACAGCHKK